jgi:hypothetical protein
VYTDRHDAWLAREAQRAGAFYESRDNNMGRALGAYLSASLPEGDRRDPDTRDRRHLFRGGRRCTDGPAAVVELA